MPDFADFPPRFLAGAGLMIVTLALFVLNWYRNEWISAGSGATDSVIFLRGDDPDILQATQRAQRTLPFFIEALQHRRGRMGFMLKVEVRDAELEVSEFMWFDEVKFQHGKFTGRLANDAVQVRMKYGTKQVIVPEDVVDWKCVEGGVMRGAFSIRVLRDRMTTAERAAHDQQLKVRFEDEELV